jgi:hypothetical protein
MRRKDREISDQTQLRYILDRAAVCHIAFAVENEPYIVPLNFGYRWDQDSLGYGNFKPYCKRTLWKAKGCVSRIFIIYNMLLLNRRVFPRCFYVFLNLSMC